MCFYVTFKLIFLTGHPATPLDPCFYKQAIKHAKIKIYLPVFLVLLLDLKIFIFGMISFFTINKAASIAQ